MGGFVEPQVWAQLDGPYLLEVVDLTTAAIAFSPSNGDCLGAEHG
jgi:hypothetical protein